MVETIIRFREYLILSRSHSPQAGMYFSMKRELTLVLTEQTKFPDLLLFRIILALLFSDRSSERDRMFPSRVQLYLGLMPPSETQDTFARPSDKHSGISLTEDTGAER